MKKNIIILGAGPAGLTAGYEIMYRMSSEYTATIIEKTPYAGGLCRTINVDRIAFDIGGHRYFTNEKEILSLWEYSLPEKHFTTVQRSSHIVYNEHMFRYPITLSVGEMKALGYIKMLHIIIDYIKEKIHQTTIGSLEEFYISRFGRELYHTFFETYTEKICGRHPSAISPEWGYHRVGKLSISTILLSILKAKKHMSDMRTTTDLFYYPKYGSGELWNHVADEFIRLGGEIIYNESVAKIDCYDNSIHSITCNSGNIFKTDYLISSIPIRDLLQLIPSTPESIIKYGNMLSYRDITVVTFLFQFDSITGRLKKNGKLITDQWLYIQDKARLVSRIQLINNWSETLIKEKSCVGLSLEFFTSIGDAAGTYTDEEWINLSLSELLSLGYIKEETVPVDQAVCHQEKAYPCYYDGYKYIYEIQQYINAIDNMACIGRNGQHHYSNIDQVMINAFKAANWIAGDCEKKDIWSINSI